MCFLNTNIYIIFVCFLDPKTGKNTESEHVHRRPLFSNCSVDSELLGKLFSYSVFSEIAFQDMFKELISLFPLVCIFHFCGEKSLK